MNDSNFVSILIPIYNVEKYIEKCSRSLFEQTYPYIEYIFVNDKTPDASMEVLTKVLTDYPKRKQMVKIIHHSKNQGLAATRNTAIQQATGKYLLFVDSDDYLDINTVETLVDVALQEKADVVSFAIKHIYTGHESITLQNVNLDKTKYICQLLEYKSLFSLCAKLFETRLFKIYDVSPIDGLNFGEDYVVTPRIIYYAKKVVGYNSCFYNYVHYNTSSYTLAFKSKYIDDLVRAEGILNDFFSEKGRKEIYQESLLIAKVQVKVRLLIAVCLNIKNLRTDLKKVCELYPNLYITSLNIAFEYRLILWLASKQLYKLLIFYVNSGFRIKQLWKRIIG